MKKMKLSIFLLLCASVTLPKEQKSSEESFEEHDTTKKSQHSYISEKAKEIIDVIYEKQDISHEEKFLQGVDVCINYEKSTSDDQKDRLIRYLRSKDRHAFADILESIHTPENLDFLDNTVISDKEELETAKKCITYFEDYNRLAIEWIRYEGKMYSDEYKHLIKRFETIQKLYRRNNDCGALLDKIDFAKQLEKENSPSSLEKILKACKKLNEYIGQDHPISWLKWSK